MALVEDPEPSRSNLGLASVDLASPRAAAAIDGHEPFRLPLKRAGDRIGEVIDLAFMFQADGTLASDQAMILDEADRTVAFECQRHLDFRMALLSFRGAGAGPGRGPQRVSPHEQMPPWLAPAAIRADSRNAWNDSGS